MQENKGYEITFEADNCISFEDDFDEPKAELPCGHIISSDSMSQLLFRTFRDKEI